MNTTGDHDASRQGTPLPTGNQDNQAQTSAEVLAKLTDSQALYLQASKLLIPAPEASNDIVSLSIRIGLNRQFYENPQAQAIEQAIALLHESEQLGYAPAAYRLACISLTETALPLDWPQLAERLRFCCEQQLPQALCDAAVYFGRFGNEQQRIASTALLEVATLKGSAVAMALLGTRLALGRFCQADRARANSILQMVHASGMPTPLPDPAFGFAQAEPTHAPVIDFPLDFSGLAQSDTLPEGRVVTPLSALTVFENAISEEECLYVQCLAEGNMTPSIVVDNAGRSSLSTERTSHDFYFLPEHETVYLNLLQRRMSAAARLPVANSEQLTMLSYQPGQEFRLHRDNLPPNHFIAKDKGGPGQRHRTVIAYLAAPEAGGETEFPLLGLRVPSVSGQLLCFDNLLADGKLCRTSLHAGLPVIQGVKWICTLWVRENTLRAL
jgi:hypothetical protein